MPDITRRVFLRNAAGGTAALLGLDRLAEAAATATLDEVLFDLQFGAYGTRAAAERRANNVRIGLTADLRGLVRVGQYKVRGNDIYRVILNLNTTHDIAERVMTDWRTRDREVIIARNLRHLDQQQGALGNYSTLPVDTSLDSTITRYVAAYTNADIRQTAQNLTTLNRSTGVNTSRFISVPTPTLKPFLRSGLEEGKHYQTVKLDGSKRATRTLYAIASNNASGKVADAVNRITTFNGMTQTNLSQLRSGIEIAIPNQLYRNPTEPRTVEDARQEDFQESGPVARPGIIRRLTGSSSNVRSKYLDVIQKTNMPAILLESFFISNPGDLRYFRQDPNLRYLSQSCAQGVTDYSRGKSVKKVILAVGHGKHDPGAIGRVDGREYHENDFNRKIARYMRAELIRQGYEVKVLDYPEKRRKGLQGRRLRNYIKEANAYGTSSNSVFVSVHVNAARNANATGFRVYVPTPKEKNPKSTALGRAVLKKVHNAF